MGALSNIRVLDLTRILAGPWATQILADLGAEVIKIERPGSGDDTRNWGPPYLTDADGNERASAYFLSTNRNKDSVAIDIADPAGRALIQDLVKSCDVVVENFKVGGLKKYGLDYDTLKELKPDLVYCSITGFGQTGPHASRAGYDFLIQGLGGLMSVTGQPDGTPGGGPVKVGVALADILTGLYAAIGILAALRHRDATGAGQHVDLSLLDVQAATLANQASSYLVSGEVPARLGNAHPSIVPYQAFAAADGHMILAIGNDGQFARFCALAGAPDLADDPRFATNPKRVENRNILVPVLERLIAARPLDWWVNELEKAGIAGGPINTIDRVFANPQLQHRQMAIELPLADGTTAPAVGSPLKLSATPVEYKTAAPALGEQTKDVLRRLVDLDDAALAALKTNGVIGG